MLTTLAGALYGAAALFLLGVLAMTPAVVAAAYYRWRGRPMPNTPPLLFVLALFGAGAYLASRA